MRRASVLAAAVLLAVASSAWAGGFATSGLSSLPDGLRAGEPWHVDVTVLAHGRTPATGLEPRLVLTGPDGARRTVAARATASAGVYRATVTFPTAGRWRYALDDGYGTGERTTFPPVRIAAAAAGTAPASDDGPGLAGWLAATAAFAVAAAAVAATAARVRRRRGARAAT